MTTETTEKARPFRFDMRPETHRLLGACAALQDTTMGSLADKLIREGLAELAKQHPITQENQHGR